MAVEILGISLLNIQYYMAKLNKKNNKNILFITTFLLLLDYFFKAKRNCITNKKKDIINCILKSGMTLGSIYDIKIKWCEQLFLKKKLASDFM